MITEEMRQKVCRLNDEGMSRTKIARTLHIGNNTIQKILGKVATHRNTSGQVSGGWIVNHPYEECLREEERQRYHEVVRERQIRNPNMGWDYESQQQVSYRNGVIYRPC